MSDLPVASPAPDDPDETRIIRFLDPSGPQFWCSVPVDTPEGRSLVFAAREGASEQASRWINRQIQISNLLLHPVKLTKLTGEIVDLIRAVMIAPDGVCIGTCSSGIVSSLRTACQIYGRPPWDPPLAFEIVQWELKGERRLFKLIPCKIEVPAKERKK